MSKHHNGQDVKQETRKKAGPAQAAKLSQHDLAQALISLSQELWVTKDRLRVLETIIVEKGLIGEHDVNTFQPDEALQQTLSQEREHFLHTVLQSFQPA